MLLGLCVAACGRGAPPPGPAPVIELSGRPLGNSFVSLSGSGFPAATPAVVTSTTPKGATTVNATTDGNGNLVTSIAVPQGYQGALDVRATVGSAVGTTRVDTGKAASDPGKDAGVRPLTAPKCTTTADVASPPTANPADATCPPGQPADRLIRAAGGTAEDPVTYFGAGSAAPAGIDVTTDNVVVEGFTLTDAHSMGARLQGNNITFQDNTITHPVNAGDDTDGMRFFGDGISIVHNSISDVSDGSHCDDNGCGNGPHPDCMQTWYSTTYPTSSNITIEGNRCENIASQCLIAEGPHLPTEGINGEGASTGWTFYDNYCNSAAAQAVQLKNITNVTVADNDFDGRNNKAIALANGSTGAHVGGNTLGPKIEKLITFDDGDEAPGYVGPTPDK